MKDFAMTVWEMPAGEFTLSALIVIFGAMVVRQLLIEINTNRIKRFNR